MASKIRLSTGSINSYNERHAKMAINAKKKAEAGKAAKAAEVKATKARVYYAMGKYTEAAKYAREVINATQNFKLNTSTSLDSVMRFPASKEMIFGVYAFDFVGGRAG